MREKLIELVWEADKVAVRRLKEENPSDPEIAKGWLADHLLANGVIVLPCKVGDTVWYLVPCKDKRLLPFIHKTKISQIVISSKAAKLYFDENRYFAATEFGKTVFLTREEAEAALKGDTP